MCKHHLHQHEQTHAGTSTDNSDTEGKNTIFKKLKNKESSKNRNQTYSFENVEGCLSLEELIRKEKRYYL